MSEKSNIADNIVEPGEASTTTTENVSHEDLDPLLQSPTVDRAYSAGYGGDSEDIEPIPEPDISAPNLDEVQSPLDDPYGESEIFDSATSDGGNSPNGGSSSSKSDYNEPEDDFGFELNGETAMYLLEFAHTLFKNRYKIDDKTLENYGLDPAIYNVNVNDGNRLVPISKICDDINEMMDEVKISSSDKKQIKKIITEISKKHDVKMSIEAQLFILLSKVGFETHIQLKSLQMTVIERLSNVTHAPSEAPKAPDMSDIEDSIKSGSGEVDNDIVETEEVNSAEMEGKKEKSGAAIIDEDLTEPGE